MADQYIPVYGKKTSNNTSTLGVSGGTEQVMTWWLGWTYAGGFTNAGWFWEDAKNPLKGWWENTYTSINEQYSTNYTNSEDGFKEYINGVYSPNNLDAALGNWIDTWKVMFIEANADKLKYDWYLDEPIGTNSCVTKQ